MNISNNINSINQTILNFDKSVKKIGKGEEIEKEFIKEIEYKENFQVNAFAIEIKNGLTKYLLDIKV